MNTPALSAVISNPDSLRYGQRDTFIWHAKLGRAYVVASGPYAGLLYYREELTFDAPIPVSVDIDPSPYDLARFDAADRRGAAGV